MMTRNLNSETDNLRKGLFDNLCDFFLVRGIKTCLKFSIGNFPNPQYSGFSPGNYKTATG